MESIQSSQRFFYNKKPKQSNTLFLIKILQSYFGNVGDALVGPNTPI